jgi:uncharacterized phage-associated protein
LIDKLSNGNADVLDKDERETVDGVLDYYGDRHPQWLSDLTHAEAPWKDARGELPAGVSCQSEITLAAMLAYYEALPAPA